MLRHLSWWGLAVGICLAAGVTTASADVLDPPTIGYVSSGRGTVRLLITPGASGAPGGFTVEWIPAATFDLLGGWPDASDPRIQHASFGGMPTLNTTDGTTHFRLTSVEDAGIQIGDVFDETGVATDDVLELDENTEYVFRARANGTASHSESPNCGDGRSHTRDDHHHECRHTQGYWKNHSRSWPTFSVKLGSVYYSQGQLLDIFDRAAKGNGLIALAHQLIAAKLNMVNGVAASTTALNAIAQADALIGSRVVPPIGSGYLAPNSTSNLTEILDEFNNGEDDDEDHCNNTTPTGNTSWGRVKAIYR